MKKLFLILIMLAGNMGNTGIMPERTNMDMNGYDVPESVRVDLQTDYGQLNLHWHGDVDFNKEPRYRVLAEGWKDGEWVCLDTVETTSEYYQATDLNAYVCQEYGFCERSRFVIEFYQQGVLAGYGISDEYDPADFFPELEEYEFGKQISLDEVVEAGYTSSGMMAENNFSYTAHKNKDGITLYAGDKEIRLKKNQWEKILEYVAKGRVVRENVMDPEIEVLDGGERVYSVRWNGMRECEESYLVLMMEDDGLLEYFRSLERTSSGILAAAGAALAAAGAAAGALIAGRRKKNKN